MKARVSNLYNTEAAWESLDFVPYAGELIVYAPDYVNYLYTRIKVGDGKTSLRELPFFTEAYLDAKLAAYQHSKIADGGSICDYF